MSVPDTTSCEAALLEGVWLEEGQLDWTQDMVRRREPEELVGPPAPLEWPPDADRKMIRYLTRYFRPRLWRNPALQLYSNPQESREEFIARCREVLREERSRELQKVGEVFLHRFLELEQRLLEQTQTEPWEEDLRDRRLARIRNLFSSVRDSLSRCFLREDPGLLSEADLPWEAPVQVEFQERLQALKEEFIARYNAINAECEERACRLDRYEVPLSYGQVEIVSMGVLWR